MRPRNEEIFVKIMRNGMIPQLGICGPIPNPIKVTRAKAHSMIVAGIAVYQYFPDTQYTEKLTLQTVFGGPEKETVSNKVDDKKISEPVKPVSFTGVKKIVEEKLVESANESVETTDDITKNEAISVDDTTDTSNEDSANEIEETTDNNTHQNNNNNNYNRNKNNKKNKNHR